MELDFVLQELFGLLSFANCCDLIMSEGIYFNNFFFMDKSHIIHTEIFRKQ